MPVTTGTYFSLSENSLPGKLPIILLHGAGGNHLCWPIELRRLAGHRVLALDLPGHGRSPGVAQHTIEAYGKAVRDFLDALGIYRAVLVGYAMGGAIAQWLALEHPSLVAGLGLISTGAYLGVPEGLLEDLSNPLTYQESLDRLRSLMVGPQTTAEQAGTCMQMLKEVRPGVFYGDWSASEEFDLRQVVSKIEAPTWVAVGSDDRLTPLSYANFLASRIRTATLQVIPGTGHMIIFEKPEALAQGLTELLERVTRYESKPATRQRRPRHTEDGPAGSY
ncbi:MAG TPA: alpha/beta hydrolase [Anaerolineaceae bacterium]|nr:alpha/beta hydrolase [Anaerolineaceae bacterium]